MNNAAELVGGEPAFQLVKVAPQSEETQKIDVSQVELIDRGRDGKFIFVPSALRVHLFTYLDIENLFEHKSIGLVDSSLPDHLRRTVKNSFSVPVYQAITRLEQIKEALDENGYGDLSDGDQEQLRNFLKIIEDEQTILQDKFGKEGVPTEVTAEELTMFLNAKGRVFSYRSGTTTFGFITHSANIKSGFSGPFIEVNGMIHSSFGEGIAAVSYRFELPYYRGLRSLKDLGISMLSNDKSTMDFLVERGKKYVELVATPSYQRYQGSIVRRNWWSDRKYKADGRVMVDIAAMRNIDPDYGMYFGWDRYERRSRDSVKLTEFTPEQYASMPPYVYGFSFSSKVWGEMSIDNLTDVEFRDDAYDMLVMEKDTKDMVFALVDNSVVGAKDFIDGKGGGCIFLLAGPPGGGKTLTAEAIAERLERPLYMVGVGELGTDVEVLEESLRKILDVATTWNAVLLIDECDIFMEKRSDMDVHRNAMVGVFLRLLEYYEGVLFLTTNRATNIDQAFYSRISLALHYDPLNVADRKIVWGNLLKVYGVEGVDIEQLAHYELNGRKIKGVIRIAKALAAAEGRQPEIKDFVRVIDKEEEFKKATGSAS